MSEIKQRNYGIDLLRCLSMFMIVILHLLSHGGVMNLKEMGFVRIGILSLIESFVYPAINVFAMISGYVMVDQKFQEKKIIMLWIQVMFYSLLLMGIICLTYPDAFSLKGMVKSIFPTLFSQYWYFTSYFGMYFFIPFMNHLLNGKNVKRLVFTCIIIFSLLPTLVMQDVFVTNYGYSTLWLSVCYLIGGYIKIYTKKKYIMRASRAFIVYAILSFVVCGSKVSIQILAVKIGFESSYSYYLLGYGSPIILLEASMLLIGMSQLKINENISRILKCVTPSVFSVYLIHENYFVKQQIIIGKFSFLNNLNPIVEVFTLLFLAIGIFFISILIDQLRIKLFKWMRIRELIDKSETVFGNISKYLELE